MATEPVAALMSIRQPFTEMILSGEKRVELRRVSMKRPITHVVIYEAGGAGVVVGYFHVSKITEAAPATIWRKFRTVSGLTKSEFDEYYAGADVAVAIEVAKAVRLRTPRPLSDFSAGRPPQSFMYISASHIGIMS